MSAPRKTAPRKTAPPAVRRETPVDDPAPAEQNWLAEPARVQQNWLAEPARALALADELRVYSGLLDNAVLTIRERDPAALVQAAPEALLDQLANVVARLAAISVKLHGRADQLDRAAAARRAKADARAAELWDDQP